MALNFDSLIIDRVLELVAEDSEGNLKYILNNLSSVSINTTSETKDKTDAQGVLIKRFFTAKTVEVSAEASVLSLSALAEQYGSEKQVASSANKIIVPRILTIDTTGITEYIFPEGMKPVTPITKIYARNNNGSLGQVYNSGVSVSATDFTYDDTSRKITFPTGISGKVVIKYNYETESGVAVANKADKFPKTVALTMKVLVADTCSVDTLRAAYVYFPSFQVSPDVDLTLETDSNIPYSGVAQRDYCATNTDLFVIYLSEDDVEE